MYKVYCFLTKNPTRWGLFSRFWTTGNEKSLHSAPHHNRPSHTTVTIKWTFFTPLHNPNSPTIRTLPHLASIQSQYPTPTTHLPSPTPHSLNLLITLHSHMLLNLISLLSLFYLLSLLNVHTYYPLYIITHLTPQIPIQYY